MDCIITLQDKLSADFKTTAIATPPTLLEVCALHLHLYVQAYMCVFNQQVYYIVCVLIHYNQTQFHLHFQ